MKLTFLGATETVTGSKYLLEDSGKKILIDCGLFQGKKDLRLRNWASLPVNPASIDAVLLTHAHLDHSGYIPKLVKGGFKGPVYCSKATFDLCKILLPDSGHIQEEDADSANRHSYSKHHPALPLYTEEEARNALQFFKTVDSGKSYRIGDDFTFSLFRAGHILGASFIRVTAGDGTSILFSGDIGRPHDPVMKPPAKIQDADYLVVESTYGDRLHDKDNPADDIEKIVRRTAARGGTLVIPAFAVGRAQALLYYFHLLREEKRIPANIPIYLDSPMAIDATGVMKKHMSEHRLSPEECEAVCHVARYTRTPQESKEISENHDNVPRIIISASGMATGGRVLHHLKRFVGDERNTVLLAGYQAAETRGDRLARGEKEIKIHGQMWPVRAEIVKLDSMSAHADYEETLTWMDNFSSRPRKVFVTHGEAEAANAMRQKIEDRFGWDAVVPAYMHQEEM